MEPTNDPAGTDDADVVFAAPEVVPVVVEMTADQVIAAIPDDEPGIRPIVLVHEDGRECVQFPLPEVLEAQALLGWTPRDPITTITTRGRRAGARG